MQGMTGVPWQPVPGRDGIETKSKVDLPKEKGPPPPKEFDDKECVRRRPKIRKEEVGKWGIPPPRLPRMRGGHQECTRQDSYRGMQ